MVYFSHPEVKALWTLIISYLIVQHWKSALLRIRVAQQERNGIRPRLTATSVKDRGNSQNVVTRCEFDMH
jgi:hypothetical protein